MASTDITALIDYYVREKDITRERVIQALGASFITAYNKMVAGAERIEHIHADINPQRGTVKIKADMIIVPDEELTDPFNQISYTTATKLNARRGVELDIGDYITVNITPPDFGRIAVQTARQTMQQRIRRAEQEMLADAFRNRIGEVVTGTVRRFEKGDIIVAVERFEGIVPSKQRIPNEDYGQGDQMRFYVVDVRDGARGNELILSRSHPNLVRRLFENEVIEISENTVEIVNVVRDAGYRTKLVVRSLDPNVDPIGACVGMRGMRVKNVVNELNREKIDIMEYNEDKAVMVAESLAPIEPVDIRVDDEKRVVTVIVADDKAAAKAKGRKGLNVRLTARLISSPNERWDVRVDPYSEASRVQAEAQEGSAALAECLHIDTELAYKMVASGFTSVEIIAQHCQVEDLVDALDIEESQAQEIIAVAQESQ